MKAIEIKNKGENAILTLTERPAPIAVKGEALIRIEYAGINRPDLLQAAGLYEPPEGVSDIPGLEVSGVIAQDCEKFKTGDRVCALLAGGGYAEYAAVPEGQVLPVPKGLSMEEAGAIPETFFTVWGNLAECAALERGQSVLIHGGSSGIGTAAIQLARNMGALVYITAGNDDKCRACEKLGATAAINYKTDDFVARILALTGGRGVNVVLDMVGGDYVPRNLKTLADKGRHVSIAVQRGRETTIDLLRIMSRRLTLTGSTLRAQPVAEKARLAQAVFDNVWPWLETGAARPVIFKTLPLARAQEAHTLMRNSAHIGKIMLKV